MEAFDGNRNPFKAENTMRSRTIKTARVRNGAAPSGAAAGRLPGAFRGAAAACLAAALLAPAARAQTCSEPVAANFRVNTLIASGGLKYPVHLAVAPDGRVFIAEMNSGEIRLYKPGASGTTLAGTVPSRFDNEDGLLGVTLHPRFAQNGFLFAIYTTKNTTAPSHVLYRYKVTGDAIDIAGGVKVLEINRIPNGKWHAGGGLAWDADENLIIGTGDDTNPHDAPNDGYGAIYYKDPIKDAQKSAANSNDLRGKVLRIHPVEPAVDGKYYTIPSGNLFPVGTAKTRPEILAMGARNPYRVSAHPRTGWVFFGDVGPDAGANSATRGRSGHDELNLIKAAGNYGWPYCNGNNFPYNNVDYSGTTGVPGAAFNCANLSNTSPNNTGIQNLPPATAPVIWYASANNADWTSMGTGGETAMAGPIYKYDTASASTVKFPPEYDGRLMFWDWTRRVTKFITFDNDGKYKSMVDIPVANAAGTFGSIISAEYGPDGALYILRNSTNGYSGQGSSGGLFKVDYVGPRNNACLPPPPVSARHQIAARNGVQGGVAGHSVFEMPAHADRLEVYDLAGRRVWSATRDGRVGALRLKMPAHLAQGVVRAKAY